MKFQTILGLALAICLITTLDAQIASPKIGLVRYADHSIHSIFGLQDDYVISRQIVGSADAISFSDAGGLWVKNGEIQLVGPDFTVLGHYESNESAPLLNVDGDLSTALVWLPTRHALLHWNGTSFAVTTVNASLPGSVMSIHLLTPTSAKLLIAEAGGAVSAATISLETGDLISLDLLAGVTAPAFAQQSFVLFHDERGLEILSSGGAVRTLLLQPKNLAFERIASEWLHISSPATKQDWVLHLTASAAQLSELPGEPSISLTDVHPEAGK